MLTDALDEVEVLASGATYFNFSDAESDDDPDSATSPISSVSGRLPEDSTPSTCKVRKQ